jgi:phosphatidate cytidylyltransferase
MVQLSPPKSSFDQSNFGKRTLSTAIGGPIAVGAVLLGSPYVDVLAILLTGILLWEWSKMSSLPLTHPINALIAFLIGWTSFGPSAFWASFCLMLAGYFLILFYHYRLKAKLVPSLILLSGPVYIGLGMASILSLAKFTPLTLLWALMIVWTTDIGAYVVGTIVGGPKLVPTISPGKTWAGFIAGSMLGSALGITIAPYCQIGIENQVMLFSLTLLTTFVGHTGDILESAAKRLFKVKDSSHIIPGHGGLLDRIDSLLLVALFFIILKYFKIF